MNMTGSQYGIYGLEEPVYFRRLDLHALQSEIIKRKNEKEIQSTSLIGS